MKQIHMLFLTTLLNLFAAVWVYIFQDCLSIEYDTLDQATTYLQHITQDT